MRVAIPTGGRPFSLLPGGLAWVQTQDCPPGATYSQCRSVLLSSRDFGENWIAYDLGETSFEELHFIDHLHGWARGGESGHGAMKGGYVWGSKYIYRTEDGGKRWQMIR